MHVLGYLEGWYVGLRVHPGTAGLLGWELMPKRRFGTELADYARFWADVGGIFHTDELPAYGITQEEVDSLYNLLGARKGVDAIVIVADEPGKAVKALETVVERARMAFHGVPEETRGALEDGTTKFLRPRPGSARMYPETDIPPLEVTEDMHQEAEAIKPEPVEAKMRRLVEEYGLSRELAEQVISDIRLDLIERLIQKYGSRVSPKVIASLFVVTLRGLRGEGVDIESISDEALEDLVALIAEGRVAKEAAEDILKLLAKDPRLSAREAAEKLGLTRVSREEAERIIDKIIADNIDAIKARGEKAYGLLMGRAMAVLRGRIEGKIVAEIVRRKLQEVLSKQS
jgi:glutamyl-tRNA(Gln) amidotransferase subunit E